MFEAKLNKAAVLKHVLDSIRELVSDVNFDCEEDGMKLQAMDNSHVALVAVQLASGGFSQYRCDRQMTLGINIASFQKIVKCAGNDDILTLRAHDDADQLNIVFETLDTDRIAEYEMKMMDIDIEHLGIPETIYDAEISMPSAEFGQIIRDLKEMGESLRIEATKEGVKFSANGDVGKGSVILKPTTKTKKTGKTKGSDDEDNDDDDDAQDKDQSDEEDDEEDTKKKRRKPKVKKEADGDESEDNAMNEEEEEEDAEPKSKKRKTNGKETKEKKRKPKENTKEEEDLSVSIALQQSVSLTFSIKYLSYFTKGAALSKRVTLHMSNEVPLLVAFEFDSGYVRYYLAPKIEDD
ncbi:hypothetical protein O181_089372 [Austropuccinia psidii MF-1]|uniref:DNA sliding clamp PCNA n=1 Tax=Austropuccinia psidii MF-1 TaxID=1389203 RepID=A0A9Q3ITB4_9BASI|nr:hypothetical protein [Austropuccinia psidii MF-1]